MRGTFPKLEMDFGNPGSPDTDMVLTTGIIAGGELVAGL
jgi:hypothetical protein